jgi:hypothetical protein
MNSFGEILERFVRGHVSKRLEKAKAGGESRELIYRALLRGRSPNILDFRIPQKHVGRDKLAW